MSYYIGHFINTKKIIYLRCI